MLTCENIYFLRIVLVLYEVCSYLLRQFVNRELTKSRVNLDQMLKTYEEKLKYELHGNRSQLGKLFPSGGKSDINTWDCHMLAVVTTLLFRLTLTPVEKRHINNIKRMRNEIAAHRATAALLEEHYEDAKDELLEAITELSSSFDTCMKEECLNRFSSYCSLNFDMQQAQQHLKDGIQTDDLIRQVLDAVSRVSETVCNAVRDGNEAISSNINNQANRLEGQIISAEKTICQNVTQTQQKVTSDLNGIRLGIVKLETQIKESNEKSSEEIEVINDELSRQLESATDRITNKVDSTNCNVMQEFQEVKRKQDESKAKQDEHNVKMEAKLEELKLLFENSKSDHYRCSKTLKFGSHTRLTVDGPSPEWIYTLETILEEVFDLLLNNLKLPGTNPKTEKAIEELVLYIRSFDCIELKSVEKKCIILVFECSTYDSLRELFQIVSGSCFQDYLDNIARALEIDLSVPHRIHFSSEIPVNSLQLIDDSSTCNKRESMIGVETSFQSMSISAYMDLQEFEENLRCLEETAKKEQIALLTTPVEKDIVPFWDVDVTTDTPKSLKPPKCYVDNARNRKLGRVGMQHGTFGAVFHKEDEALEVASETEVYKDTEQKRRCKRVGLPKGTAVFSETIKSIGIQYYQDSSLNRRLGRVGLPRGSKPAQKKSSATKKIPEILSRLRNEQVTNYEELECRGTGNDSDEDSECSMHSSAEAVEKAQLQYNRFHAEMSWKRFSVDPPKTVPSVLKDYVGKKIPFSELKLHRPIGRGGFGEVYFAKWKETVVAVKKMRVENSSEKKIVEFSQEVMKFCTLNHENIVKFIGACVEMPNICIVMEYMQTSLFEAIHSSKDIDFSNEERLSILQQTCQGIRYLHSKRIAHCDLKTPNVLLDYVQNELCSVKITDFGLSMVKNDALTSTTNSQELVRNIGTPRFSAPEILRGDLLSAKEMMMADIYSLGLVFFEVIFEEEPFPDYSRDQLKQQVGRLGNKPTVPDMMIDENLQDIMERAWSYSPRERPKIADICNVVTDCKDIYLKQSNN